MENAAITYKCPECGGELLWNGELRRFFCDWCSTALTEKEAMELNIISRESTEEQQDDELQKQFAEDTDVYVCNSCGAEIFCDHNTAATFCYYCHNPVSIKQRLSGSYRPEMIIPFVYGKRQAIAAFKAHCMKKWFLPSDFLSESQLEKITGLYVPFWLADCDVDTSVAASGKEVETRFRKGEASETITKTYSFDRSVKMKYMGIPADGAMKIEDSLMDAIEPYDYKFLREFDMSYLSGFYCDKCDVTKEEVRSRVKKRIDENALNVILDDLKRYESVVVKDKKSRITGIKWHYMMLPVWFLSYKHHGEIYGFAMNGQTGKFAGKFPLSGLKVVGTAIAAALIVGFLVYKIGGIWL